MLVIYEQKDIDGLTPGILQSEIGAELPHGISHLLKVGSRSSSHQAGLLASA